MHKRVAILGAGYIAHYHLDALRLVAGAKLVAVCDINQGRAHQLAASAGVDKVYTDLSEMLEKEALDSVHVLTPANLHFAPARHILEARVGVFLEKPLAIETTECDALLDLAQAQAVPLGTSHNYLYAKPYEALLSDWVRRRFGRIDQIDIVWQKPLPQLKSGPFDSWLFAKPHNILFEVAAHTFAHALHLAGELQEMTVTYGEKLELPGGNDFYQRWEIQGKHRGTHVRILLSFKDGFSQHYIAVRGANGSAVVDFEHNTYVRNEHEHEQMDLDRFTRIVRTSRTLIAQATTTMAQFALAKAGRRHALGPFADSIFRAVSAYYNDFEDQADARIVGRMGARTVRFAEKVAEKVQAVVRSAKGSTDNETYKPPQATILVTGGTGFIGKALVRRLRQKGHGVRVLVRTPAVHLTFFGELGVEVACGDMQNIQTVQAALEGIKNVYHLARGEGETWMDYEKSDLIPTKNLAKACLERNIQLIYTSSIAVHAADRPNRPIQDETPPHIGCARTNIYARTKAESEWYLQEQRRRHQLDLVILRPGIVIGRGRTPLHAGIAEFPYASSLCVIAGSGDHLLPIVLLDECADAMALVLERQQAGVNLSGCSFNLVGEASLTAHQYLDELEAFSGVKLKRVSRAAWQRFAIEIIKYLIKKMGRNQDAGRPCLASIKGLGYLARYDLQNIKQTLGWTPTTDRAKVIAEGIQDPAREFFR